MIKGEYENSVELAKDESMFAKTPAPQQKSVKQPAAFTKQLAPIKTEVGKPARFVVEFSGDQPIQVTWAKDGRPIASSFFGSENSSEHGEMKYDALPHILTTRVYGTDDMHLIVPNKMLIKNTQNNAVLEIGKTKTDHSGNYTVRIQNAAGLAESTANLIAGQKVDNSVLPAFQQVLSDLKGTQGHPARFDIRIAGKPQSVTWFKDGKQIIPDARCQLLVEQDTYTLLITEALPQDSGIYECIARNSKGEARCKGTLQIPLSKPTTGFMMKTAGAPVQKVQQKATKTEAPKFIKQLADQNVTLNDQVKLNVEFAGAPSPVVVWLFNGQLVPSTPEFAISNTPNSSVLTINKLLAKNVGKYTCKISNQSGQTETSATLKSGQKR
uniref:Ig-like domain-containing protein n=1 Tax=Romanomermis culicivorax TaxID=13658 RepID=A0A915LE66_ROMCU